MSNLNPPRNRQSFFAVDVRAFEIVIGSLGVSAAAAYLVLARGQGPLRRKDEAADGNGRFVDAAPETAWSAKAIGEYTSINWPSAQKLIGRLVEFGAITVLRASTKPKYRINPPCQIIGHQHLGPKPQWTWIPTAFVAPNKSDEPLIRETGLERLLQTGRADLLLALVQLYAMHDLEEFSGVPFDVIHEYYSRLHIDDSSEYRIWGFNRQNLVLGACKINHESIAGLHTMGYLDFVPHVMTRYDLERPQDCLIQYPAPQHPLAQGAAHEDKLALGGAHEMAANAMLPDYFQNKWAKDGAPDILIVERRHFDHLQVVGILRLTGRPLTGSTLRWLDRRVDWQVMAAKLQSVAAEADRRRRPYLAAVGRRGF